jgi:hypothetical protein
VPRTVREVQWVRGGGEAVASQGAHRTYQRGGSEGGCLPVGRGLKVA